MTQNEINLAIRHHNKANKLAAKVETVRGVLYVNVRYSEVVFSASRAEAREVAKLVGRTVTHVSSSTWSFDAAEDAFAGGKVVIVRGRGVTITG